MLLLDIAMKKEYSHILITYNPRHPVALEELKGIRDVIIKHSDNWVVSIEHSGTTNQHLHAYVSFKKPKARQNIRPLFEKESILYMIQKQKKEEWKNGLKINYLDSTEHYKKYYIGYCVKEEGEHYPLHRKIDKNESQIQSTFSNEEILQCFHYYEENKEEVEKQKTMKKFKGNIRKEEFYNEVIEKIKTDTELTLGKPQHFKLAIKKLIKENKRTIMGFPKYLIRESFIHYNSQYCDDDTLLDMWLDHKLNTGEECLDAYSYSHSN